MSKVDDVDSSNCHFPCPLPKKHPFLPLILVEAGTLIKKLVGEHWLEKARKFCWFFRCRKYFARQWLLVEFIWFYEVLVMFHVCAQSWKWFWWELWNSWCFSSVWFINLDGCCVTLANCLQSRQVEDLRYVPQHRLESWGVPLKLHLSWQQVCGKTTTSKTDTWLTFHNL